MNHGLEQKITTEWLMGKGTGGLGDWAEEGASSSTTMEILCGCRVQFRARAEWTLRYETEHGGRIGQFTVKRLTESWSLMKMRLAERTGYA